MKIEVQNEWYSVDEVLNNPDKIYVYGDNLRRNGKGGQAQIRSCMNTVGIATKREPSNHHDSFFSDEVNEIKTMLNDIEKLYLMHINPAYDHYTLVFPYDGIGTGLAKLPEVSPAAYCLLTSMLDKHFGIKTYNTKLVKESNVR